MNRMFVHTNSMVNLAKEHGCCVRGYDFINLADGTFLVSVEPSKVDAVQHIGDWGMPILVKSSTVAKSRHHNHGVGFLNLAMHSEWGVLDSDTVEIMLKKIHQATGNHAFHPDV